MFEFISLVTLVLVTRVTGSESLRNDILHAGKNFDQSDLFETYIEGSMVSSSHSSNTFFLVKLLDSRGIRRASGEHPGGISRNCSCYRDRIDLRGTSPLCLCVDGLPFAPDYWPNIWGRYPIGDLKPKRDPYRRGTPRSRADNNLNGYVQRS